MSVLSDEEFRAVIDRVVHELVDARWPRDLDDLGATRDDVVVLIEHASALGAELSAERSRHEATSRQLADTERSLENVEVLLRQKGLL